MTRPFGIIFPLIFLISITIFGQEKFITGKLVDSEHDEPIVFASIRLKGKALGVISNMDGGFKIPLEFRTQGDTIRISSMGYASKDILLQNLKTEEVNLISLRPALEVLDEVVVSGVGKSKHGRTSNIDLSAHDIVRFAIKSVHGNYPRSPYSYVGYYRDYQLKDSSYINLNEALFEVFDSGFGTIDYDATKTRIYKYILNTDFQIDTTIAKPYDYKGHGKTIEGASLYDFGGNEFMILRIHDAVRNYRINSFDYVNVFALDFEKNHSFKREADIISDDEKLFVVSIRRETGQNRVEGKLFISQANFAIHKMEYALYRGGKNLNVSELYKYSKAAGDKFFDIKVEYKPTNGVMYLNYISVNNDFRIKLDPNFRVNSTIMNWDDLCYEIHFSNPPPLVSDAINKRKYNLRFKGKKIKIYRIEVKDEIVRLFTQLDGVKASVDSKKWKLGIDAPNDFDFRIKNIKDINGNRINQKRWLKATQFREFFVQQIKPDNTAPKDYLYMDKRRPIFKNQPIARPKNVEEYWMNTPLKKMDE